MKNRYEQERKEKKNNDLPFLGQHILDMRSMFVFCFFFFKKTLTPLCVLAYSLSAWIDWVVNPLARLLFRVEIRLKIEEVRPTAMDAFVSNKSLFFFCLSSSRCNYRKRQKSFFYGQCGSIVHLSQSINFIYPHLNGEQTIQDLFTIFSFSKSW